ncbi:cytochrome b5 [Trifolium repens]|nr:cytochrome b5 [Trifolium repens]
MIEHREDIYSRPKRTWFVTEKEKKVSAKAAKTILKIPGFTDDVVAHLFAGLGAEREVLAAPPKLVYSRLILRYLLCFDFENLVVFYTGKDATVDFEDVGHSDSAIDIMEKYFVREVDTTTLPAEARKNTPPPVQATTLNNQSSGFLLKFLQYLVPLFILGFAFALQYYGNKKQVQ